MQKLFLSWSGETSHKIAQTLYTWIPSIIQNAKPFISSEDLRKGGRWNQDLSDELEGSSFGILCLTKENFESPWILFEAGALSKIVSKSHVCPVLIDMKPSELSGPLTQFNAASIDKHEFLKLIRTLNSTCGEDALDEKVIERSFNACWPEMEKEIKDILESNSKNISKSKGKPAETENNKENAIEEILSNTRNITQILIGQGGLLTSVTKELGEKIQAVSPANPGRGGWKISNDHPVWAELVVAFERIVMTATEMEIPSEVKLSIYRMYPPIEYIMMHMTDRNERIFSRKTLFNLREMVAKIRDIN